MLAKDMHQVTSHTLRFRSRLPQSRQQSTQPPNPTVKTASAVSSFDRFIARTPTKFLRTRLQVLKNAPLTHITAFLVLHEITAVVPLFGLAGAFHYYQWLPPYFAEGAWVLKGVSLFGNYFRRKGWISSADAAEAKDAAEHGKVEEVEERGKRKSKISNWFGRGGDSHAEKGGILSNKKESLGKWWNRGEGGTRLVIEFATAYAVVKALLPLRIVISVWGAPWFARSTVVPIGNAMKNLFRRKTPRSVTGTGKTS